MGKKKSRKRSRHFKFIIHVAQMFTTYSAHATDSKSYDEIPAADPAATRDSFFPPSQSNTFPNPLAIEEPISTLGPSGPKELPVPSVKDAATAFNNGLIALFALDIGPSELVLTEILNAFNPPTITPPLTGTNITLCQTSLIGSSLSHEAPREGIPSQKMSRIS